MSQVRIIGDFEAQYLNCGLGLFKQKGQGKPFNRKN